MLQKTGLKVSSLNIAQVKRSSKERLLSKCGIELGENFNLSKSENAKQSQCPIEKMDAIEEALRYFQMI